MPVKNQPKTSGGTQGSSKKTQKTSEIPVQIPLEQELEFKPFRPLVFDERLRLQQIFNDPVFRQAWANAQGAKPSVIPMGLDGEYGPQIGNNRLHQLQGWEMMKIALLRQAQEPRVAAPKITDNYPDAGTIEADAANKLKK